MTYPSGTLPGLTGDPSRDDDPADVDLLTRVSFDYLVDVVAEDGDPEDDAALLIFELSWESPSDHELFIYDSEGEVLFEGTNFNPLDGSTESGTLTVDQCSVLTFETKNYLGVPAEAMTLEVITSGQDGEEDTVIGEDTTE